MRSLLRRFVVVLLRFLARCKLARSRPITIGITGSVGKTSTKDALVCVLSRQFQVKAAEGGYNTELGVPLMILNQRSDNSSRLGTWLGILWGGLLDVLRGEKMEILVVEMGVDKPGDMRELTRILSPHIAIFTSVAANHIAPGQFTSEQDILQEKALIAARQRPTDIFITNNDNPWIDSLIHTGSTRLRYGEHQANEYVLTDLRGDVQGIGFHLRGDRVDHDFTVPILGTYHASIVVPAIIAGLRLGMSPEVIQEALTHFVLPKGRLRLLPGLAGSTLIDSSYNASHTAMLHALDLVASLTAPRRILVLGQMNELGDRAERYHREVARRAADIGDLFILVGKDALWYEEELLAAGKDRGLVRHFLDSREAGDFLAPLLQTGDLVFIKGSQGGVRLERLVAKILRDPATAEEVLVRQGSAWEKD